MNTLHTILILFAAFLAVFYEAAFPGFRRVFGAQVDFLPALMVYAALNGGLKTVTLLACIGGLLFDSLSANPLGVSVVPLFVVGFLIWYRSDLILKEQVFAQFVLGAAASAVVPLLTLLLVLTKGGSPLLGWGSLWQWLVMIAGGAISTPVLFALLGWFYRTFGYRRVVETTFRPDREIQRRRRI